jgi:hypothetical protein
VAVDLERERGRVVSELVLHVGQRLAHVDEQARVGVPQGVRLAVAQPGPAQDRGPDVVPESVVSHGVARRGRKHALRERVTLERSLGFQQALVVP